MTASFNLAQLANNLNTSGQLDATDGLSGLVANANLASSGTASSGTYLRGDRTWASIGNVGKILQVVQGINRDYQTYGSGSYGSWTSVSSWLSASITPSSTSSRIMVMIQTRVGCQNGLAMRLTRNGSAVTDSLGNSAGSRLRASFYKSLAFGNDSNHIESVSYMYVDSPSSTSSQTYSFDFWTENASNTVFNGNMTNADNDIAYGARTASQIILMEIGA